MEDRPTGFRFYPTEDELVSFYLHNKLEGRRQDLDRVIPVVDIYDYNPWDLPREFCQGDTEQWFFFFPRQEKENRGGRPNRLTASGYWKATGSPGSVFSHHNRIIGMKKTMAFYTGRAPSGRKTEWKMNEYKIIEGEASSSTSKTPKVFDRRPSGVTRIEVTGHELHRGNEATTSSLQNQPMRERTSSPDSSSSGDHANPSQNIEKDSSDVPADNDTFWDLEPLNWFD
ncbi:unnamed protein product [Ilex paraguariensis]|uniref:NAC domain-containing protein n=1 Tax=Ilex paraguariensis TaxID=185542 RepID=A0ABC8SRK6_9AQUA